MTQSLKIVSLLLVAQIIFSCNKDKCSGRKKNSAHCEELVAVSHPTIFPLSYLPAYPGSYWKYVNSYNGDTSVIKTEPTYKMHSYRGQYGRISDTAFVPVYDGSPIWGYLHHGLPVSSTSEYPFIRILSDSLKVGAQWTVSNRNISQIIRKVRATDTTIMIKGKSYYPTIVMLDYYFSGPPKQVRISESYYTKDIGLVMHNTFSGYPYDTLITTSVLVDYFINR